jgi:hypothetical protein
LLDKIESANHPSYKNHQSNVHYYIMASIDGDNKQASATSVTQQLREMQSLSLHIMLLKLGPPR